jgi:hypothetical protein
MFIEFTGISCSVTLPFYENKKWWEGGSKQKLNVLRFYSIMIVLVTGCGHSTPLFWGT